MTYLCLKIPHNFFPDPPVFAGPHDAGCLFSNNKPLRPSQNIWIHAEIKLNTGGNCLEIWTLLKGVCYTGFYFGARVYGSTFAHHNFLGLYF